METSIVIGKRWRIIVWHWSLSYSYIVTFSGWRHDLSVPAYIHNYCQTGCLALFLFLRDLGYIADYCLHSLWFSKNSIQAFIDAAYIHGQRHLTISSMSKSTLILVSVIQGQDHKPGRKEMFSACSSSAEHSMLATENDQEPYFVCVLGKKAWRHSKPSYHVTSDIFRVSCNLRCHSLFSLCGRTRPAV